MWKLQGNIENLYRYAGKKLLEEIETIKEHQNRQESNTKSSKVVKTNSISVEIASDDDISDVFSDENKECEFLLTGLL